MATAPVRRLAHQEVNAVAVVGDEVDPVAEVGDTQARARTALARARERLSRTLLDEIWIQTAVLDVGVWGRAATEVEADRTLREAAERGVIYFDPTTPVEDGGRERHGRLRGFVGRLIGADKQGRSQGW